VIKPVASFSITSAKQNSQLQHTTSNVWGQHINITQCHFEVDKTQHVEI